MTKIVLSKSYGAGFAMTNETVYNWLKERCGEDLITITPSPTFGGSWYSFSRPNLRWHPLIIQCIEELGEEQTGYIVKEYDDALYDIEIGDYDGMEWIDLIPILDVELMTTMTAAELADYLDERGVKHNYGR